MNRPTVEQTFEHAGLQCAVLAQSMGHRCGYVLIPDDHPGTTGPAAKDTESGEEAV